MARVGEYSFPSAPMINIARLVAREGGYTFPGAPVIDISLATRREGGFDFGNPVIDLSSSPETIGGALNKYIPWVIGVGGAVGVAAIAIGMTKGKKGSQKG